MIVEALYEPRAHVWIPVHDGERRVASVYRDHYSHRLFGRKRLNNPRVVGPGQRIVLITPDCSSIFVWRKFVEHQQLDPRGINCSVFRREHSTWLASEMILEAEGFAWERWPGERLYTYVAPWMVRSSNPGYCYLMAGWLKGGWSKDGKKRRLYLPVQQAQLGEAEDRPMLPGF